MVRTIVIMVAVLLVLPAMLFSGCSKAGAPEPKLDRVPITILSHQMSVHEFAGDVIQSIAVISGTAHNDSDQALEAPSIGAVYYDKNGNLLGSASATIATLAPGATWNFSIEFKGTESWKAVTYDLSISTVNTP